MNNDRILAEYVWKSLSKDDTKRKEILIPQLEFKLEYIDSILLLILEQLEKWDEIIITNKGSDLNVEGFEYGIFVWWDGMNKILTSGTGDTIQKAKENMIYNYAKQWLKDNLKKDK